MRYRRCSGASGDGDFEDFGIDVKQRAGGEDHRSLKNVLQLADVARPRIGCEPWENA